MHTKRYTAYSLIYFCLLTLLFNSCSNQSNPKMIRAGFVTSASGAPIFHALQAKNFDGYAIETQVYKSSDLLALDLSRNQLQVALVCGISEILAQAAKEPNSILILAVFESTPCFLVPKGEDKDLARYFRQPGKKVVGCWPGSTFPYYTKIVLDSLNIYSDHVYITPTAPGIQTSQLEKREIAALFTLEPIGVKSTVDGIAEYRFTDQNLLAKFISRGKYFPGGCLAVSRKALENNKDLINALLKGLGKTAGDVSSNNPITIQALTKYVSLLPNYTAAMKMSQPVTGRKMIGGEMKTLVGHLQDMNQLPKDFKWEDVFWTN